MRNPFLFLLIFSAIILAIDFYAYSGVKKLSNKYSQKKKRIIFCLFWIVPSLLIAGLIIFSIFNRSIDPSNVLVYFHYISGTFILFYIPKLVFIIFNLVDDLIQLGKWLYKKINRTTKSDKNKDEPISRKQFLTRTGIVIAGLPFLSIAYGIKWGKFNYTTRNFSLSFSNLPASFNGLRIVQISDFHIGSFLNSVDEVEIAVELINEQHADLLLFTGDFVNNLSSEMNKFIPILNKLRAKIGKYSILGNHDYGEYVPWDSLEEKRQNLDRLVKIQEDLGFRMLLNESHKVEIDREKIELVGVENWGLPPFPQYGDLNKALSTVEDSSFKILLSHDPTHWDEQVLEKTNIDLTLSGHTHGAQFGIEIPGWRWSPVNMRYKRWGGLYTEGKQSLYVNTGIGFIGFPGRVGMPPEITVIELKKS
ncbi:MAG: metallophosphoesterase [Ignavibacteriaceae bacterium]